MDLTKIPIKIKYQTSKDELIEEFYVPVLKNCNIYLRSAGYFTSMVLLDYITGLEAFVENCGKMRLLISPNLTMKDAETLLESQERKKIAAEKITSLFMTYKKTGVYEELAAKIFVSLINEGYMEVKIAIPKNPIGIFHEKIAIFQDPQGESIATNGSNNETSSAIKYNIESFNTFCSWKDGQLEYVNEHKDDFDKYWNNLSENITTMNLKEAVDKEVLALYETDETIKELYTKLKQRKIIKQLNFVPYEFQKNAAIKWLEKTKGILSYATGVGKTKTAILCIYKYLEKNKRGFFVIVVPDKTLAVQWNGELADNKYNNIVCYSDNPDWKVDLNDYIDSWNYSLEDQFFVIVTKQTFGGNAFQTIISKMKNNYIFIADECHHLGTFNNLQKLPNTIYRLGLSATPEVYLQEERTDELLRYFAGILDQYSIGDAIRDGFLVPYEYYPIVIELTKNEKNEYDKFTHKIVKLIGTREEQKIKNVDNALEMLLFQRAKVLYGAENKLNALENIISDVSIESFFLIYCGVSSSSIDGTNVEIEGETKVVNESQLERVNELLNKKHIISAQYTQSESSYEREKEIMAFKEGKLKSLVAIKCLDEGVNIPEIRKAVIMASSGNPREFIQRRGRLLRRFTGKEKAVIYDMVVFSPSEDYRSINRVELKRVHTFAQDALNNNDIIEQFNEYFEEYLENTEVKN